MRRNLTSIVDNALTFLLLLVAGATPLIFLNQTTEFYEMPKLAFLVVSTTVLIGLWIFSWILKGKITLTRTPLDIPLLVILVAVIASAFFSDTRFPAIFGNFPRVHGSAVSWVTYILLYFVTVSHLKNIATLKSFLYVLYGSASLVALITLLSFFGIFLPFDFAGNVTFTPTGSTFSTVAFLLLLLPLPLFSLINPNKYIPTPFAIGLSILFGITIMLIGSISNYVALAIVFGLVFFLSKPQQIRRTLGLFLIPAGAVLFTAFLAYVPLPGALSNIQQLEANFPKEIQLPFSISWKISASAFRDEPFIGTGPSTYLFNFTNYKPIEFNQEDFWSFSFDSAYNEYLHVLGTLGLIGFLGFMAVSFIILNNSRKNLMMGNVNPEEHQDITHLLMLSLGISGVIAIILLALHATTLVSIVVTLFIFAALMASQKSIREHVTEFSMGLRASTAENKQIDLLPVIIFVIFLVLAAPVLFQTYNTVLADYHHRQALLSANTDGTATYENLQRAEQLNPYIDLYRVDIAQTNFALANAIAVQNGPTEENPQGTLTDQDRTNIQTLLSQAINEGRAAVVLSPRSARNWEVLASIYRNIAGVAQNALAFSLDSYGQAIQQDPLNPALRLNVGGIYYAAQNYDLAIRFFSDAANLKPDYANAYYNLSIALRDSGDLENAKLVAERTVNLIERDNPNYETAFQLLEDINARIAGGEGTQEQGAPAGETDSALGDENIGEVGVEDLNTPPDEVATPAAVQPNPEAGIPQFNQDQQQAQ